MNIRMLRFFAGQAVRSSCSKVRRALLPQRPERYVAILVEDNAQRAEKLTRIRERLIFFAPEIGWEQIRVCERMPLRELSRGIVLVADSALASNFIRRSFDNVFDIDFSRNATDGWQFCELTRYLARLPVGEGRQKAATKLRQHLRGLPRYDRCYLFGTGTSLERALQQSFDDGYRVVCNTIVRDPELWRHLKPHFVVAGDAIYHFGFTAFAQAFRRDLAQRLRESGGSTLFVYPELFHAVVQREMPDLISILVPIPVGAHERIHVDLNRQFRLPALGNVLNNLLLPLGCTLSRNIHLWGFDGRAPNDKLFWSNSTKHSYPELMQSLIDAHPAFYETLVPKNKEESYVNAVHGDELEARLQEAEREGFSFTMMHPSWTKTLQRRYSEVESEAAK
jgi:hypothetical protein